MNPQRFKLSKKLSFGEEVGNSVIHGVGALLMLGLLPFTAVSAFYRYGIRAAVGMSVFVSSLFMMFLSSAIYHSMAYDSKQKYILRIIDHSMIFIAIAGSYMPIALSVTEGWLGYVIIALQWGITLFGILYKTLAKSVNEKFSLVLYLVMGWLIVFILPALVQKTSAAFWAFMVAGGVAYTVGAAFYTRKKPFAHLIWHVFILLGSLLHYIGIVFFML